jgi:hypothetical protein
MKRVDFTSPPAHDVATRADRSPMNPKRWEISFLCGASMWITSKRKPSLKKRRCPCEHPR